jgi:hypothetical protein
MSKAGTHALEDRVPQDEDAKPRRHRAEHRADAADHQSGQEAAFPTVAIGQLAPGNHQRRHDQEEEGDGDLDTLHAGVQVVADVVDHHVHVRAGEACR